MIIEWAILYEYRKPAKRRGLWPGVNTPSDVRCTYMSGGRQLVDTVGQRGYSNMLNLREQRSRVRDMYGSTRRNATP